MRLHSLPAALADAAYGLFDDGKGTDVGGS